MTIWLVRHGQSVLNAAGIRHRREDTPLTTEGIAQAAAVTVPGQPLVLTSPLMRAYGTACIIAANHGTDAPILVDELAERDWDQTCDVAAKPAADYLRRLSGDILVVTHAGIIKGLLGTDVTPANCGVIEWQP